MNEKAENISFRFPGESEVDYLLRTALDVASQTLKCGGEIHRVEDTIQRICFSQGAEHVEVFAISSLIVASVRLKDGTYSSQSRRIYGTENRFERLGRINQISRSLCNSEMSLDDAQYALREVKAMPGYPKWVMAIAGIMGAGSFTFLFGGGLRDALCAGIGGLLLILLGFLIPKSGNVFFSTVLQSFAIGVFAHLAVLLGLGVNKDAVIIGSVMLLVPGLSFGNALRDLLGGDTLAGILGIIRSLLLAASIAFGLFISSVVTGGLGI